MTRKWHQYLTVICKCCDETGEILLIILWMSYFLRPRLISLLIAAKAISQQKRGQNFTSFIATFTDLPMKGGDLLLYYVKLWYHFCARESEHLQQEEMR
jgi:hypothetical protein